MNVTLLSDFGTRDGYVGALKGSLLRRAPGARLIDVSHDIAPGAIASGAFVLAQAAPHFPSGTVHLAVVDPGVGSERRAIACEIGGHHYVAPDNGLLTLVLDLGGTVRAHLISRSELWNSEVSPVFHGRDIFAPVAAHLAASPPAHKRRGNDRDGHANDHNRHERHRERHDDHDDADGDEPLDGVLGRPEARFHESPHYPRDPRF